MSMSARQCIKTLERRYNELSRRILASDKDLTYDKREASALRWAVEKLAKENGYEPKLQIWHAVPDHGYFGDVFEELEVW